LLPKSIAQTASDAAAMKNLRPFGQRTIVSRVDLVNSSRYA
jgi:hypothetical protein